MNGCELYTRACNSCDGVKVHHSDLAGVPNEVQTIVCSQEFEQVGSDAAQSKGAGSPRSYTIIDGVDDHLRAGWSRVPIQPSDPRACQPRMRTCSSIIIQPQSVAGN